jgi:hypothetical protein
MIEYVCEGCGIEVKGFGRSTIPAHQYCAVCEWLCEYHFAPQRRDLSEFWTIYEVISKVRK